MHNRKPMPAHARQVFKGEIFEVWQWEQRLYDGSLALFERLKRTDTTNVIATVEDKILLQTQEQPDTIGTFVSLPGGQCERGEDALTGAKRELVEETGYSSMDWTLLCEEDPVWKIEWTVHTYIARNCVYVHEPRLDAGEKIDTRLVSFDEFLALATHGDFGYRSLYSMMVRASYDPIERNKLSTAIFGV